MAPLTLAQAAELLGVSASTLRNQVKAGRLRGTLIGKTWTVTPREVERYRAENLGRQGRPRVPVAVIPWPGNRYGAKALTVTTEGLKEAEQREIVEQVQQLLAGGAMWTLADVPARMVSDDPAHTWDCRYDEAIPSIHFWRRSDAEPGVLASVERSPVRQEIKPPSR